MTKQKREAGKIVRKVTKLDKQWRAEGKKEGRTENKLAHELGNAYRAGLGDKARQAQTRNAGGRGERSGWEK